jgi:hypothetical protein
MHSGVSVELLVCHTTYREATGIDPVTCPPNVGREVSGVQSSSPVGDIGFQL